MSEADLGASTGGHWLPPAPVVSAFAKMMRATQKATSAPLPPEAQVLQAIFAVGVGRAIAVAADLDLAEHLSDGPLGIEELAGRCEVDAGALDRMLRVLVVAGWFRRPSDGVYANNRSSSYLASGSENSIRGWARFVGSNTYWSKLGDLGETVRLGVDQSPGIWEMFAESEEEGEIFDQAMSESARFLAPLVAEAYDWGRAGRVCDVGGGTGTLLSVLLRRFPALEGAVADIPAVAEKAAARFESIGLSDRATAVGIDAFESVPEGFDHYVMTSILHDWGDEACRTLLSNVRRAMPDGGRLLTVDFVLPETGLDPGFAHDLDFQMLVLSGGGRERTVAEFEELFDTAEMKLADDIRLPNLQHLLVIERR